VKELPLPEGLGRHLFLRIKKDHNVVSLYYGPDGKDVDPLPPTLRGLGYNHNVMGEFLALNPAILAAGTGEVRLLDFSTARCPERRSGSALHRA
jgi:xylan 1,4-beta-xylosidase